MRWLDPWRLKGVGGSDKSLQGVNTCGYMNNKMAFFHIPTVLIGKMNFYFKKDMFSLLSFINAHCDENQKILLCLIHREVIHKYNKLSECINHIYHLSTTCDSKLIEEISKYKGIMCLSQVHYQVISLCSTIVEI